MSILFHLAYMIIEGVEMHIAPTLAMCTVVNKCSTFQLILDSKALYHKRNVTIYLIGV